MDNASVLLGAIALRVIGWVAFGLAGGFIAARKGYSPMLGIIGGVLFGPCGLFIGLLLPRTADGRRQYDDEDQMEAELRAARDNKTCPQCACQHSVVNRFCPSCMFRYPE